METQTETSTNDVNEGQLPDWLVGVIVVIVLLVMAVIILIITTFIKNRSKSRSNMFSTTVCDDLESGKVVHNMDSTMMTSLTSIPNSINDDTFLSHSVAVSAEYNQQIPSPSSADVIYGVLGCRNPLFVDDENETDENNTNGRTLASIDELDCVDLASSSEDLQVPATSSDYLEYEATSENKAKTLYVRKTSMYQTKIKQAGQTRQLYADGRDVQETKSFDSKCLQDRQTSETSSVDNNLQDRQTSETSSVDNNLQDRQTSETSSLHNNQQTIECGEDGLASTTDSSDLKDLSGCFTDESVQHGLGHSSLSLTIGSNHGLCDTDDHLVINFLQSVPRLEAGVNPCKNAHLVEAESQAAVQTSESDDDDNDDDNDDNDDDDGKDKVNDLSRPLAASQNTQCPNFVPGPHTESEPEMYVYTTSGQQEISHSSTTQAGGLEAHKESEPEMPVYTTSGQQDSSTTQAGWLEIDNPSHRGAASADESVDLTSTFPEDNPQSSMLVPTLAVPTVTEPTPAVPTFADGNQSSSVVVPTLAVPALTVPTFPAATPSSVSAESTPNAAISTAGVAAPTQTLLQPTLTSTTPILTSTTPTLTSTTPTLTSTTPTLTSTTPTPATESSTQEIQATIEPVQCQRGTESHKQNSSNQQPLGDLSIVVPSPAIVENVSNQNRRLDPSDSQDRSLDPSNIQDRSLDPSDIQDLVASDDVDLQTLDVTRPCSDPDDEDRQWKGSADIFNVHL